MAESNGHATDDKVVGFEDISKTHCVRSESKNNERYWALYRRGNPAPQGIFDDPVLAERICLLLDLYEYACQRHPVIAGKIDDRENIFAILERAEEAAPEAFTIADLFRPEP